MNLMPPRKYVKSKSGRGAGGVLDVRIYHSVGSLRSGDTTLYVFVSAVNREVAFRMAREVLESKA